MRKLMLLTAAALVVAAFTASGASASKLHVFFPGDCQTNQYKPKTLTVACADANFIVKKVHWKRYGAKRAKGTGTAHVNDCKPNCVSGAFHNYPAKVRLSRVRQCGDVPQFTRLTVRLTGKRPQGLKKRETIKFPCANAPSR